MESIPNLDNTSPEEITETIEMAALQYGEEIFVGYSHAHALDKLALKYPHWERGTETMLEGFITNTDRFVTRDEAGLIAKKVDQIEHLSEQRLPNAERSLDSDDIKHLGYNPNDFDKDYHS